MTIERKFNHMKNTFQANGWQLFFLVVVRVLLGWYFLYEGVIKLLNPNWTAFGFLKSSEGVLSNFFNQLADSSTALEIVNFMNVWGLIAIGLGLMTGTLGRLAAISGAILVFLYYLAHPATIEAQQLIGAGQALLVDKNLIFTVMLLVLFTIPTSYIIGFDRLIFKKKVYGR
jgi:thiosulfate dehydrogenase [quinone] large subunit